MCTSVAGQIMFIFASGTSSHFANQASNHEYYERLSQNRINLTKTRDRWLTMSVDSISSTFSKASSRCKNPEIPPVSGSRSILKIAWEREPSDELDVGSVPSNEMLWVIKSETLGKYTVKGRISYLPSLRIRSNAKLRNFWSRSVDWDWVMVLDKVCILRCLKSQKWQNHAGVNTSENGSKYSEESPWSIDGLFFEKTKQHSALQHKSLIQSSSLVLSMKVIS